MNTRHLLALIAFVLLTLSAAPAPAPRADGRTRSYRVTREGKPDANSQRLLRHSTYTLKAEDGQHNGRPAVVITRQDLTVEKARIDWRFIVAADSGNILWMEKKVTGPDGALWEEHRTSFAHVKPPAGRRMVHRQILGLIGPWLDLRPNAKNLVALAGSSERRPANVALNVVGEEKVTTPAGTFNCVKISMEYSEEDLPSFAKYIPSALLDSLLTGYFLWVDKAAPHAMVRMSGKLDGPGGGTVKEEMVR